MTGIEWTDETWNPVTGCTKVSLGCRECYAERVFARVYPHRDFGNVKLHVSRLDQPLRWRAPRRIFVNSLSDLFHESLTDEQIDQVFAVMAVAERHHFQVLTKRPKRMRDYLRGDSGDRVCGPGLTHPSPYKRQYWPPPNVWLGVSVEHQKAADERIPILLDTPCGGPRFVSVEPLLGPVVLDLSLECDRPDWIIVGGESGPGARPCELQWVRSIVNDCREWGVPCFVKQLGSRPISEPGAPMSYTWGGTLRPNDRKGGDPHEWPPDLRVREFPVSRQQEEATT